MGVTVELFRNATDVERFPAGGTIFREGDRGEAMYVVLEGTVEVSANGRSSRNWGRAGSSARWR